MWVDAFSPDRADGPIPIGTMGFVCAVHGERLSPPRGWTIDDRRIAVPRLFKVVADRPVDPPADRGTTPTKPVTEPKTRSPRKDRTAPVPRPSLFADLGSGASTDVAPDTSSAAVDENPVVPVPSIAESPSIDRSPSIAESPERPESAPIDDSTELEIRQDVPSGRRRPGDDVTGDDLTGDATRPWIPTFDPDDDLNGMLDATTPLLRDAFRSRHNGRSQRDDT